MEFQEFTAGKNDDGRRLDRILRILLQDKSLGEIYKLLRKGLIKVNNKNAKPDFHVKNGDTILIAKFLFEKIQDKSEISEKTQKSDSSGLSSPLSFDVVFENEHLLIIDKPYGRTVHGSENKAETPLSEEVTKLYLAGKNTKDSSLSFKPGPLHRLDRNTTGLLVFSNSLEGARWFSDGIKNHTISKKYWGLAEGNLKKQEIWEDKLSDSEVTENGFFTVSQNENGNLAQTSAKPMAHGTLSGKPVTLVEYSIKTGRKHQIRAQSSLHGYPLAGDSAYGGHKNAKLKREYYLQAFCLSFPPENPLSLPSEIKMKLSADFLQILQCCEIKNPGL